MIKDRAYWEAWEAQGPLPEPLTPEQAFAVCNTMYEHAKSLGAFPPADPLAGIETKIAVARAMNFLPPLDDGDLRKLLGRASTKANP
jgi:hypothetical protein